MKTLKAFTEEQMNDSNFAAAYDELKPQMNNFRAAIDEYFEKILLFKKPVLYTPRRIRRDVVPQGLYKYELRQDDESTGEIVQIAHGVMVNFEGTILSYYRLLEPSEMRDINEATDICYPDVPPITIPEYLRECKERDDKVAER